jgi:quinol monooxygenase YgiN
MFGMFGKLTAKPGHRDDLLSILLDATRGVAQTDGCRLYTVNTSPDDPDGVWIYEVWDDQEAHAASLQRDETKAAIKRAMPLLAGPPDGGIILTPVGGHGLTGDEML